VANAVGVKSSHCKTHTSKTNPIERPANNLRASENDGELENGEGAGNEEEFSHVLLANKG
jgi:hypothetical protein